VSRPSVIVAVTLSSTLGLLALGASAVPYRIEFDGGLRGGLGGRETTLTCPGEDPIGGIRVSVVRDVLVRLELICQGRPPRLPIELSCKDGEDLVGMYGAAGQRVDRLGVICRGTGAPYWGRISGGYGGDEFEMLCPKGERVSELQLRSGAVVDAVGVSCSAP
jgi:hypothetical protein